jgi:hypothetical protein
MPQRVAGSDKRRNSIGLVVRERKSAPKRNARRERRRAWAQRRQTGSVAELASAVKRLRLTTNRLSQRK